MHRRTLSKDGVYYFLFSPSTVTILYLLSRILVWLGPFFFPWLRMKDDLLMIVDEHNLLRRRAQQGALALLEVAAHLQ